MQTLGLDLAAVTTIDAAGIGELLQIRNHFDRVGGRFVLMRPGPCVLRLLSPCGLDRMFEITESESSPTHSFRSDAPVPDKPALLSAIGQHAQRSHPQSSVAVPPRRAEDLARLLVDKRAAACVNIVPHIVSVFRWDDATQVEEEILMFIKTTTDRSQRVQSLIKRHHTYEVPEIVRLDGEVLHKPYMEWLRDCLA